MKKQIISIYKQILIIIKKTLININIKIKIQKNTINMHNIYIDITIV